MLGQIFNVLPEWAVSAIVAAGLWFGVNYIWLATPYFESRVSDYNCSTSDFYRNSPNEKFAMALHTATLGIMEAEAAIMDRACAKGAR